MTEGVEAMKRLFLAAAIAAFAVANPLAQEAQKTQPASSTSLNVQFVLSRYQGDKKISSMPYMLGVLSNGPKTSLRIGTQVPVVTNVFGVKSEFKEIPQQSYTYRDVGTNIDCQAMSTATGQYNLNVTVEDSSIHLDRGGDQKLPLRDVPAFRSFRASFSMQLREGQTMQYASATDPVSGEVMKIEVTLNVAK
jgi:hypothetical protein